MGPPAAGSAAAPSDTTRLLNINVGVLGHVDSGKTSLVAALSTLLSTAALDKHPQSKERGITLDLGFSSFSLGSMPERLSHLPFDELQFTLVDCPGHASLIRTIIGGVSIIDMMLLVIDVTKGLQAQTAECLVLAEVATPCMLVVLNKIDLLPEQDRAKAIRKAAKRLAQTLAMTKFAAAPMIPVCAKPLSPPGAAPSGIDALKDQMVASVPSTPREHLPEPLLMAVDHCFAIKGQGTVLTGTVLKGSLSVGQVIELPALKLQRPVRSIQAFRRPVSNAMQGDRVGVCVSQLDPSLMERGLVAAPGTLTTCGAAVAAVEKIRFFAGDVRSGAKMHVNIGHTTVMAEVAAFGTPDGEGVGNNFAMQAMLERMTRLSIHSAPPPFDDSRAYLAQEELYGTEGRPLGASTSQQGAPEVPFSSGSGGAAGAAAGGDDRHHGRQWLLLRFLTPVTAPSDALVFGARLELDVHGEQCRLAFFGRLVKTFALSDDEAVSKLKVYKVKERYGVLERMQPDGVSGICRGLFKKQTDLSVFIGLRVTTRRGETAVIEGAFGKSGKFRVQFDKPLRLEGRTPDDNQLVLRFKKYVFAEKKDGKAKPVQ